MITRIIVRKNQYRDSVFLMVVNKQASILPGIEEIAIMMGTDNNKDLMVKVGFDKAEIDPATANDMVICIRAESEGHIEKALLDIDKMLVKKMHPGEEQDTYKTLDAVMRERPETNFAVISVPGEFAAREARKALNHGLNVLLFSDNVSIEEEIELKGLADQLDRIVMGPDCGTAIINYVGLAFANVVKPGHIGVVAATGTGLQEVVSVIDQAGEGITQAIGTGGRDLSDRVKGVSMLKGIDILENDPETKVILIVSKPPGLQTAKEVLRKLSVCSKKTVVNFIGADQAAIRKAGAIPASTLEEASLKAVAALRGESYEEKDFTLPENEVAEIIQKEKQGMKSGQKYVRGLYSGGALCDEALAIMSEYLGGVFSNIPLKPELRIEDLSRGFRHSCIDLGDDYFTKGKPHPMIYPDLRNRYILGEAADGEVAVLLLDIVLGYGAHMDMAGALSGNIVSAKSIAKARGGYLSVVASVCGTKKDPQNYDEQVEKLKQCGVVVMPSNAQAARLAAYICQ
jgi:FdrA protein